MAVAAHCLLWWIGTSLLLGNVHTDTSEIAYWGRSLALGYSKHPPLPSWIAAGAMALSPSPIVALLAIGQACIGIAAVYVWATIRLFASPRAALIGVVLLLASPAATLYAVQVNHNTLLLPFWAATAFYAARYLEGGRLGDAVALGLAAALGFLSKYEILVLLLSILAAAMMVEPYRKRLLRWQTLVPILIFAVLLLPHMIWLVDHRASSLEHATLGRKLRHAADFGFDIYAFVLGQVLLFGVSFVVDLLLRRGSLRRTPFLSFKASAGQGRSGPDSFMAWILFGPIVLMVLGSLVTWQTVKPLWIIPFMPSMAMWVGYRYGDVWMEAARRPSALAWQIASLSFAALALFLGALATSILIGRPIDTYVADTHWLGTRAQDFWRAHDGRPLRWVLTDSTGFPNTSALWIADAPQVDFFTVELYPATEDILRSGGIAVLRRTDPATTPIAGLCATDTAQVMVPASAFGSKGFWPVTLAYLPPREEMATQCPDAPAADHPAASGDATPPDETAQPAPN